jgi:glycosyltransferase involved in cell wall biosynthesis
MTLSTPRATILIPAYNEAEVIGHTLASLTRDMRRGEFRIVVVPNACRDATAQVARDACPQARVIETQVPGKAHAMNLGHNAAPDGITIVLDADLTVTAADLRALIAPIEAGQAEASCGRMAVDLDGCSPAVRAFYAIWSRRSYASGGKFGGVFALSEAAAARIFPLPAIIADDTYVSRSVPAEDKAFAPDCSFTARVPRDLSSLIRVRRRVLRGNRELARMGVLPQPRGAGSDTSGALRQVLTRPSLWAGLAVYALVGLVARAGLGLEGRLSAPRWERDDSTRVAPALKAGIAR